MEFHFFEFKSSKALEPNSATNKNPQTHDPPQYKNRSDNHLNKYFPILIQWSIFNNFSKRVNFGFEKMTSASVKMYPFHDYELVTTVFIQFDSYLII